MIDFERVIRSNGARILPEAQIATLREAFAAYGNTDRFAPGDLVTPRSWAPMKDAGSPHIVLEVNYDAEPDFCSERGMLGSSMFGRRYQIRFAGVDSDGDLSAFWTEAYLLERYRPKPDRKEQQS